MLKGSTDLLQFPQKPQLRPLIDIEPNNKNFPCLHDLSENTASNSDCPIIDRANA